MTSFLQLAGVESRLEGLFSLYPLLLASDPANSDQGALSHLNAVAFVLLGRAKRVDAGVAARLSNPRTKAVFAALSAALDTSANAGKKVKLTARCPEHAFSALLREVWVGADEPEQSELLVSRDV